MRHSEPEMDPDQNKMLHYREFIAEKTTPQVDLHFFIFTLLTTINVSIQCSMTTANPNAPSLSISYPSSFSMTRPNKMITDLLQHY
jgi:hypothetical protein